jgi:hypothetical protein
MAIRSLYGAVSDSPSASARRKREANRPVSSSRMTIQSRTSTRHYRSFVGNWLEPGDLAAWSALALSVLTSCILAVRALVRGRAERRAEAERVAAATKLEEAAQAEGVTAWVEDRIGAPPEVVVRNASADPIKFVVVSISRVGADATSTGSTNAELRTYRALGPGQAIREEVTLTAVGGIVRADAAVKFINKNLRGCERSDRLSLSKCDYRAEDFPYFDVPIRHAGVKAQDASSVRHDEDELETKIAGGHWPI